MAETPKVYHLNIGDVKCTIFRDMMFSYPSNLLFSNVDETIYQNALKRYHEDTTVIPSPYVALLIEKGENKILLDTGVTMSRSIDYVGRDVQLNGILETLLNQSGTSPADITHVILTHFHPDHIGGVYTRTLTLLCPNAKFFFHKLEWDYWNSSKCSNESPLFHFFIDENIKPLAKANVALDFITTAEYEILEGISTIHIPGHTTGQIALRIESKGDKFLYISDAWLHPLHIEHLDWQCVYDNDPYQALKSRLAMLELAYSENALVQSFHFPFPGLGHVDKSKEGWRWVNLD